MIVTGFGTDDISRNARADRAPGVMVEEHDRFPVRARESVDKVIRSGQELKSFLGIVHWQILCVIRKTDFTLWPAA
jgi:hypothetical protein